MVSAASELVRASPIVEGRDWRDMSHAGNPKFGVESLLCAGQVNKESRGMVTGGGKVIHPSTRSYSAAPFKRKCALFAPRGWRFARSLQWNSICAGKSLKPNPVADVICMRHKLTSEKMELNENDLPLKPKSTNLTHILSPVAR